MLENLIAFLWGLAEATLFFIVPDVGISLISLNGYRAGVQASVYALAGALLGGTIMYYWGRANLEKVDRVLKFIPAIRPVDIDRVRSALSKSGVLAILLGPTMGIPYKIYAAHAHLNISFISFLLISVPARMVRFVFVAVVTPFMMEKLSPGASVESRVQIVVLIWAIMYAGYFYIKSRKETG